MLITDRNKAAVILSPQLAKATFLKDSHFEIIIVHEKSTQNEFYWQYIARTRRTPRKSWRFAQTFARDLSPNFYRDFDSFVAHYVSTREAEYIASRVQNPRRLAQVTSNKTLTPSVNPAVTLAVMWSMKDKANGIYKQAFNRAWWYEHLEKEKTWQELASTIPADEVHVFYDECPTCGRLHNIAHYPDGKVICADMADTHRNPALHYSHFEHKRFIFKFNTTRAPHSGGG